MGNQRAFTTLRLLGVVLVSMLVASATTVGTAILIDRGDRSEIVIRPATPEVMAVAIEGAISTPGVYDVPANARLVDVIEAAGGLAPDADPGGLNLAALLADGETISVASMATAESEAVDSGRGPESAIASVEPGDQSEPFAPIDINRAPLEVLETLPGIGPVLGQRIIDSREVDGPFVDSGDLVRIEGISDSMVAELDPLVTTGD